MSIEPDKSAIQGDPMFKKLLASVGIGSASIDTRIITPQLMPGFPFEAQIIIQGGEVDQDISGLSLALMTEVKAEIDDQIHYNTLLLGNWRLSESMTLEAGREYHIPFNAHLHPETPITSFGGHRNQSKVWLQTGLDIDLAVDAGDHDTLTVEPTPTMQTLLEAMAHCGYRIQKADVEKGFLSGNGFKSRSGCYQELEFVPSSQTLFGVKEIEVSFVPDGDTMHALIEIDRAFREDSYRSISWHKNASASELVSKLQQVIG